jgi:hypothetical protein
MPEEEHAAVLAARMLAEFGVEASDIEAVLQALRALYDDRLPCAGPCRIVQDADRLDKLGALGVGAFFTKAALRGRGLIDALAQTLSRELTYAQAAPRSSSRKQARSSPGSRRRNRSPFSTIFWMTSSAGESPHSNAAPSSWRRNSAPATALW